MDRYLDFPISNSVIPFLELARPKQPNGNFMAFFFFLNQENVAVYLFLHRSQVSALTRKDSEPCFQLVGLSSKCPEPPRPTPTGPL